jgi:hypothetical protein
MNLVNPIHGIQKSETIDAKSETKNLLELKYIFLVVFKVKEKYIILTPLIIWNYLT